MPRRKQKRIRSALVNVVGEQRVRMAEDIGLANARLRASENSWTQSMGWQEARMGWWTEHYVVAGIVDVSGILDKLRSDARSDGLLEEAVRRVDYLLRAVGVRHVGLAGRKPLPSPEELPQSSASA